MTNGNYTAAYSYLANAPLVSRIAFRSNTVPRMTTTRSYDFLNRLTDIVSGTGVSPVFLFADGYNAANPRPALTNADSSRWVYICDELGQADERQEVRERRHPRGGRRQPLPRRARRW